MALRRFSLGMALGAVMLAGAAPAQDARIAFGNLAQDTSLPVEVTSDSFTVNNADGTAVFSGGVVVVQGEMKLAAAEVRVKYTPDQQAIDQLLATGGVTITNLGDAAGASEAVYSIGSGVIVMTGDVLLTQGPSTMAGQKLTINLKDGTGLMEGRVTTTFVPGGN
jgi:lipopolysaccharide export system protein LptA